MRNEYTLTGRAVTARLAVQEIESNGQENEFNVAHTAPALKKRNGVGEDMGILGAYGSRPRGKIPTSVGKPSRLETPPGISNEAGPAAADRMRASA
jgi:hypothetical protein